MLNPGSLFPDWPVCLVLNKYPTIQSTTKKCSDRFVWFENGGKTNTRTHTHTHNFKMDEQCRQRHHKTCVPKRRIAVRSEWCGAHHRWTNKTATYRTTNCTTSRPRAPIRKPSRWCSKVRCKTAPSSNWRNWRSGLNTESGCWPAPLSVMDRLPNPLPSEPKKMVRISISLFRQSHPIATHQIANRDSKQTAKTKQKEKQKNYR